MKYSFYKKKKLISFLFMSITYVENIINPYIDKKYICYEIESRIK